MLASSWTSLDILDVEVGRGGDLEGGGNLQAALSGSRQGAT
jgi:hypothetical protein